MSVKATLPAGTQPESNVNQPGGFAISGNLQVEVVAGPGEVNGTPVELTITGDGQVRWDLDPMIQEDPYWGTNHVDLQAGLTGNSAWFQVSGGQGDPDSHQWSSASSWGSGSNVIQMTIGSTLSIWVEGSGNSTGVWVGGSGTFHGEVEAFLQVQLELSIPPVDIDVTKTTPEWQWATGGAEFHYEVVGGDLSDEAQMQVFWADNGGNRIGDPVYEEPANGARGKHSFIVGESDLEAPPVGATQLVLRADFYDQQYEGDAGELNNIANLPYNPALNNMTARYDGNSSENTIGRFFTGVKISDQFYSVTLSDELAALRPTVTMTLGKGKAIPLTATQGDRRIYQTANLDPSTLKADTLLNVQVKIGKIVLKKLDGSLLHAPVTIDMEAVPKWMTKALKPLVKSFDAASKTYIFSGSLVNVGSSGSTKLALPKKVTFGAGAKSGLDIVVNAEVKAPLDAQTTAVAGRAKAEFVLLGEPLATVEQDLSSPGDFGVNFDIDPHSLTLRSATVSFQHSIQKNDVSLFPDQKFSDTEPKIVTLNYKSHVVADVSFDAEVSLSFKSNGSLDKDASILTLSSRSTLKGTVEPDLGLPSSAKKAYDILTKINVEKAILDEIIGFLNDKTLGLHTKLTASVTGTIDFNATIKFKTATDKKPTITAFAGRVQLVPEIKLDVIWFGEVRASFDAPQKLSELFTIDAPF